MPFLILFCLYRWTWDIKTQPKIVHYRNYVKIFQLLMWDPHEIAGIPSATFAKI